MQNIITGIVVGSFTALLTYFLTRRKEDEARRREAALRHVQRQIEELHGPLLGLITQAQIVYEIALAKLPGRDGHLDQGRFSGQDWEVWRYFLGNYILPINAQMAALLRSKVYLSESLPNPVSYEQFLRHQAMLECLSRMWEERKIDSTSVRGIGYPRQFNEDVAAALDRLRRRYNDSLLRLGKYDDAQPSRP